MGKPRLSPAGIFNMSLGFLGIQIAFGLQNSNTSRIFQTLGADIDSLALLWIAAPVSGLLVQPLVGYFSDRTWGRFGRRRPYFLGGAICAAGGLVVMPMAESLWLAALMLWVIDAAINVTMEPFRAFVADLLPDEQRSEGYAAQSLFIGVGAVLASVFPYVLTQYFGISNIADGGNTALSVRLAYFVGAGALLAAVLWTVLSTREYSPVELAGFHQGRDDAPKPHLFRAVEPGPLVRMGLGFVIAGIILTALIVVYDLEKQVFIFGGGLVVFGTALIVRAGLIGRTRWAGFCEVIDDLTSMPIMMRRLAVVQFFSWFALFSMWIYTTPAIARLYYGTADPHSAEFAEGADLVGVLFGVYNGVAALAAFALPYLAQRLGRRGGHALCLSLGGIGLISLVALPDRSMLWVPMVGIGFAWSSILSAPYTLLSASVQPEKMGIYMGLFNIFIVVPQVLAAALLGTALRAFFAGSPIPALAIGGTSMAIAALLMVRVPSDPQTPKG